MCYLYLYCKKISIYPLFSNINLCISAKNAEKIAVFLFIFTTFLCFAGFLSSYFILFIIDLIGLCRMSINIKLPAQCPMSHGIPATHQLNPAYSPCLSPSAAPMTAYGMEQKKPKLRPKIPDTTLQNQTDSSFRNFQATNTKSGHT